MMENINVQYVGFEAKALVREYSFIVRQAPNESREFALAIVNEAFNSHRVRYQDAPYICSAKLHRELATYSNHPPQSHYRVSEVELDEYRDTHSRKPTSGFYSSYLANLPPNSPKSR